MTLDTHFFLGIDASTPWRAVGLSDGLGFTLSNNWKAGRQEGRDLLPRIENLLHSQGLTLKDLSGVAVANGPGSFTSLRVAASVAQGLGMGLGVPVVGVGSLEVYPHQAPDWELRIRVLLPARSGEMFLSDYSRQDNSPNGSVENVIECLTVEQVVAGTRDNDLLVGPALHLYETVLSEVLPTTAALGGERLRVPDAGVLAELGLRKWRKNPESFAAGQLQIDYRQSHGALTIEERKGNVARV